jgi:hypothetical protein
MRMNFKTPLIAVAAAAALALSACSTQDGGSDGDGGETISLNAFSVMEAANEPVFEDFEGTDAETASRSRRRTARPVTRAARSWPAPTPTSCTTPSRET